MGEKPLHTLLMLTEKPGEWSVWWVFSILLALAAGAGFIWAEAAGDPFFGWSVTLGLLVFLLADWALLATLPRRGLSFGAIQPPLLGLGFFRWLLSLAAAPVASNGSMPTLLILALVQVAVWGLMAQGTLIEPFSLQVTHVEVPTAKLCNPGTPLHIVQLSDLHVERLTRRDRALPSLVAGLNPDLIVLTGDFLSTSYNDDPRAVVDLRELLRQLRAPVGIYAVWGTQEVDFPHVLGPVLNDLGITVLEDQAIEVTAHGDRLWLMGLSCTRDLARGGAKLRALLADAPAEAFTVLLHHTPDLMPQAASLDVDLYLAGHTHGGQWRVPGF
ncbi:MAG: metallophosphoesterase, partial [Anaerolineae bacterium]